MEKRFVGKKGFEMSFTWLFALIVGAFVLFLSIYAASKIIHIGGTSSGTEVAKEIGILLNPLETGFQSSQSTSFSYRSNLKIENDCDASGNFGKQRIQVSEKSLKGWADPGVQVRFLNKYIFSNPQIEGKKFYLFSKQFKFPYKVADLVFMTSSKDIYCFIDAPREVKEELLELGQDNLVTNCTDTTGKIKVCFGGGNCEVKVDYVDGKVTKGRNKVYFEGNELMFAAIFSEKPVYECQLKRLMKRANVLANTYIQKANFISQRGCDTSLNSDLLVFSSGLLAFEDSTNLGAIKRLSENVEKKNYAECRLW